MSFKSRGIALLDKIEDEEKSLRNRDATSKDEQLIQGFENELSNIQKNFDSKVRQIIKNKNKNELKNKTFLQVSNKNVKIITPTVNKMDESLKSISNTRTNSLEQALKELQNVRKAITG